MLPHVCCSTARQAGLASFRIGGLFAMFTAMQCGAAQHLGWDNGISAFTAGAISSGIVHHFSDGGRLEIIQVRFVWLPAPAVPAMVVALTLPATGDGGGPCQECCERPSRQLHWSFSLQVTGFCLVVQCLLRRHGVGRRLHSTQVLWLERVAGPGSTSTSSSLCRLAHLNTTNE